jgi:hypothetical protein
MNIRRITLALGAAAGGLLAAAYLPMAIANADNGAAADVTSDAMRQPVVGTPDAFGFATNSDSPETVLTVSGLPPLDQQVEGYQTFDFFGTDTDSPTTAVDVGTVNTDVSTLTTPLGFTNTEYVVTPGGTVDIDPTTGDPLAGATLPTDGSVYDIANFGDGFSNDYSDVAAAPAQFANATTDALSGTGTAATGTITDTFVTPFGDIDLTPLVDSFSTLVHGDFLTNVVDPSSLSSISDLGSILGSFDFLAAY